MPNNASPRPTGRVDRRISLEASTVSLSWRWAPVLGFISKRLAIAGCLVIIVSVLVFGATQLLPGDAASAILGRDADPEALAALRAEIGLGDPAIVRYWDWTSGLLTGDLGMSYGTGKPVAFLIEGRLMNSLVLGIVASALMIPLSIVLGILAALRPGRWLDQVISNSTLALIAVPEFVIGTLLIVVLAVWLKLLPPVSLVLPGRNPLESPEVLALPVITLCAAGVAYLSRMMRTGVIEIMRSDFVQMARLNGIAERRIIMKYVLPAAFAPTINVVALTLQWLLGGVAIVETVFSYPGIGALLVQAVITRDMPLVQTLAILIAVIYILINLIADLAIVLIVPKLRTAL